MFVIQLEGDGKKWVIMTFQLFKINKSHKVINKRLKLHSKCHFTTILC